jgi:hypothetical protein
LFELNEREPSMGSWAWQLVLAYCIPFIGLASLESALDATDSPGWQVLGYVVVMLLSIALALLVSRLFVESPREGRWVFLLPGLIVTLFGLALCTKSMDKALELFYFRTGPLSGESGWGVMLLTWPTWGCCWYSAAMWFVRRKRRLRART